MRLEDLTGRRFGRLVVLERAEGPCKKHTYWKCLCDCGNITITAAQKLKSGSTKSCGCYGRDTATKHGMWKHPLYKTWKNIKSRCNNQNMTAYCCYGGRGIKVCEEWQNDFMAFYSWAIANGYLEGLTIDRIDVNGNYEPSNCRWVTMREQSNNTRRNHLIEYKGETHTISEWARITKINVHTLSNRINRGWSIERALTEKV